jgi:tetratricopeptide (TPR) repeat protein
MRRSLGIAALLVLAPSLAAAESTLVPQADELMRKAQLARDPAERFALADDAQALCEKAVAESPRDPVPHVHLARALSVSDPSHPEACRPGACERAVNELKRARELDSGGAEAERIASELGIVYSRLGAFADALAEYDRALNLIETERLPDRFETFGNKSVLYGNSAETLMALGRLGEAITRYRLAEQHSTAGDPEWQLAEWGLGVALDRDEQGEKARQAVKLALDRDPTMGQLSAENVFFEPAGDKFYYLAMGHEVAGDCARALAAWRGFVQAAPSSRWLKRARGHLERLEREPHCTVDVEHAHVYIGEPMRPRVLRPIDDLRQVLRRGEDDLKLCYARTLRTERVTGEMELALEVHPSGGQGMTPHVIESNIPSEQLRQCVKLAAQSWRFSPIDVHEAETLIISIHFGAYK